MSHDDWISDLKPEDLPEPYREISIMVGLRNALKIADKFQGTAVYLPKLDAAIRKVRDERIKKEFTGSNHKELARKYGLTEIWVRQILAEKGPDQLSLFDAL
ncbi:hypothetical protein JCM15765_02450 [Paradesulfitobacterium aromaticivorans]